MRKAILFLAVILFGFGFHAFAKTAPSLMFTEIMYDLEGGDSGREWVEVYNYGDESVEIITGSGSESWRFSDGSNHVLHSVQGGTVIAPGSFAIVAADAENWLEEHSGYSGTVFDTVMSLRNSSSTIAITIAKDVPPFEVVSYDSATGAKGNGYSLQVASLQFGASWLQASVIGGTPGYYDIATETEPDTPVDPEPVSDISSEPEPVALPVEPDPVIEDEISVIPLPDIIVDAPVVHTNIEEKESSVATITKEVSIINKEIDVVVKEKSIPTIIDFDELLGMDENEKVSIIGVVVVPPETVLKRQMYIAPYQYGIVDYDDLLEIYYHAADWPKLTSHQYVAVTGQYTHSNNQRRIKIMDTDSIVFHETDNTYNDPPLYEVADLNPDMDNTFVSVQASILRVASKSFSLQSDNFKVKVISPEGLSLKGFIQKNDTIQATGLLRWRNSGWELNVFSPTGIKFITKYVKPRKTRPSSHIVENSAVTTTEARGTIDVPRDDDPAKYYYLGAAPVAALLGWVGKKYLIGKFF